MLENYLEEYVSIDLHVHTPASNCYKKSSDDLDTEYINLLKVYVQKGVKVIGITDHNTIKGYKELMRIKSETENRIKYWKELEESDLLKNKIILEQNKLSLFDKILILPGVEFEAFPGIHVLLIFNPEVEDIVTMIEKFIHENGYPADAQGQEIVDVVGISAIEIVNKAYDLGAITIAAHIDSDKGALETLEGSGRAQFFRNTALNGVQIVKPETIDYLKQLMLNDTYKREKEFSYMRFSDYHNKDIIDGKISYFKLSNISFDNIRNVIIDHPELISFTPRIEDVDCIKKIVNNQETVTFENLKEKNIDNVISAVCAILNKGKGTIAIGIGKKGSISGMKMPIEDVKVTINKIIGKYNKYIAYFKYDEEYYELGELVIVIVRIWRIGHIVFDYNDTVFVFDEKGRVKKATSNEIFELGEKNYRDSFLRINKVNQRRLRHIEEEMKLIGKAEENVELNRKILRFSVVAQNALNIDIVFRELGIEYDSDGLGTVMGNLYDLTLVGPHYFDCYSRISCPTFNVFYEEEKIKPSDIRIGECAVINSNFSVHYINNPDKYVINSRMFIICTLNDYLKEYYSIPAIVLWLKSPILLYHQQTIYRNYELSSPRLFYSVPIVLHEEMQKGGTLDKIATEMLALEKEFLTNKDLVEKDNLQSLMDEHNLKILDYVYRAEQEFVRVLGISQVEYKAILEFADKEGWGYFNKDNIEVVEE